MIPEQNTLLKQISVLPRGWTLSFDIQPLGLVNGWANILHGTTRIDHGEYGARTPGIWFWSNTRQLLISSAVNGNSNFHFTSAALPFNKYSHIVIRQIQSGHLNLYHYEIWINGVRQLDVVNNKAVVFQNVKYYVSDPWYIQAKAGLKNINLVTHPHKGK